MKENKLIIYFDNAATTYKKPSEMFSFMMDFYRDNSFNTGRGNYSIADNSVALISNTRKLILKLLHADNNKVVCFMPSATEALNTVIRGIEISEGDNIYISPFEHNAIIRTLYQISKEKSITITELKVNSVKMEYDLEGIKQQFAAKKPSIVIISQVSNVCGIIAPVNEICTYAKNYGAITIIDGAQGACLIDMSLNAYIDYYIFAGHKTMYGPFGVAGIVCNKNSIIKPLVFGGTGFDSANPEMPRDLPDRLEAGSRNILSIAGLYASLLWIDNTTINSIFSKEQADTKKLLEILNSYSFIKVIGSSCNCISVVSCQFKGYSADSIGQILSNQGIQVRTGLHCAPSAHRFLGTFPEGTVRFSISYFTTEEDFYYLKKTLNFIKEEM